MQIFVCCCLLFVLFCVFLLEKLVSRQINLNSYFNRRHAWKRFNNICVVIIERYSISEAKWRAKRGATRWRWCTMTHFPKTRNFLLHWHINLFLALKSSSVLVESAAYSRVDLKYTSNYVLIMTYHIAITLHLSPSGISNIPLWGL